jgi:hypothetical protein
MMMAAIISAQGTSNPFDLKYRPPKSNTPVQKTVTPTDTFSKVGAPATKPVQPVVQPQQQQIQPVSPAPKDTSHAAGAPGQGNPFERVETPDSAAGNAPVKNDIAPQTAKPKSPLPSPKVSVASRGFQIFFLLLSLLLLIFIVNVERSFVRDLWRVISNENYSSLHHRNQRNTMRQILLIMGYSIFIFQAGLFLFQTMRLFHYQGDVLNTIWACIALVMMIYVVRHLMIRYLRWLFNNEKEMTLFGFDISIFNTMVGLVLLPLNILLVFGPENLHKPLVITGLVVIGAAYLFRQLRWLLTANQLIANSLFLFFIYLCAVEILPLWAVSAIFW